jgi:hypothetical protein
MSKENKLAYELIENQKADINIFPEQMRVLLLEIPRNALVTVED